MIGPSFSPGHPSLVKWIDSPFSREKWFLYRLLFSLCFLFLFFTFPLTSSGPIGQYMEDFYFDNLPHLLPFPPSPLRRGLRE